MKRYLSSALCAGAILLSTVSVDAIATAAYAQSDDDVSFQSFHDALAPYGDWVYSDRWGEVWIPGDVPPNFRPYGTDGYWAYTDDYGWMWASNYDWGDVPFHYGRWVNDPDDGWVWIPGYVWSPAWVAWRTNGRYVGWMPMPPDPQFLGESGPSLGISLGGIGVSINFGDTSGYYGYSDWYGPGYSADNFAGNWVFVDEGHMADRDFHRYEAPRNTYVTLIQGGRNITNYSVTNNYIVDKAIDPRDVQRLGGHPVPVVRAAQVLKKPQLITTTNQGRQIQTRMREENPRGTGKANSAPKPSAQIVQSLSTKTVTHNGRPITNLYTRSTVTHAPLPEKPGGAPVGMHNNPMTGTGGATNPSTNREFERRNAPATQMTTPESTTPSTSAPNGKTRDLTRHRDINTMSTGNPPTTRITPETTAPGGSSSTEHTREHTRVNTVSPNGQSTGGGMGGAGLERSNHNTGANERITPPKTNTAPPKKQEKEKHGEKPTEPQ